MRIAFPYSNWRGGFLKSIQKACERLGHKTLSCDRYNAPLLNKFLRRVDIKSLKVPAIHYKEVEYNRNFFQQLSSFCPEVFINLSGSGLFPETVKKIRSDLNCTTVCFIADNPCDPAPIRDKYFAMSLEFYDVLLLPEPIWKKMIKNLAPKSKIIPFYGGYESEKFFPVSQQEIDEKDMEEFTCDVSFTGRSYNESPEGAYRAAILGQLNEYNIKIWGDEGWQYRFQFYPSLQKAYQGPRLSYIELRKLYTISKINLNLPSPQILTGFQPRVFEIAACKGFQIIDHSDELYSIFDEDEIVTFKGTNDLKTKISYYLDHSDERKMIAEKAYQRVVNQYTWENQVAKIINEF